MTKSMEQVHRIKEFSLSRKALPDCPRGGDVPKDRTQIHMAQEDFPPKPPDPESRSSKLDPYKSTIESWLKEDEQNRYKQRHTGIYLRVVLGIEIEIGIE